MGYNTETFATIKKRLQDWLDSDGGEVTNRPLDLLNRAQNWLQQRRAWQGLVKRSALTVASRQATLPSDLLRIIRVWWDSDSDNQPDFHFYDHGRYDDGYYVTDSFAKATGHSKVIKFYKDPTHTPYVEYQWALDDFADSGTEYSYFPGDLLLRTAQKIHIEESGLVGPEYSAIENSQKEMLNDYEASHQYINIDPRTVMLDNSGEIVDTEDYDVQGGSRDRFSDAYDNSYDLS